MPQGTAGCIQEVPGAQLPAGVFLQKGGVVPAGHKADVLAVVLPGVQEAVLCGNFPDLLLGEAPQGELHPGQLLLTQAGQKIGLVLGPVRRPLQQVPAGAAVLLHPGIVAGYHPVAAQLGGPLHQLAEFQMAIAQNAGVGGAALIIGIHKGVYHLFVEIVGEIEYIVGNSQPPGHTPGILHILQGAAGLRSVGALHLPGIQPHGGPDAGISRLLHPQCSHRAVHSAAHSNQSLHLPASFCFRVYQAHPGLSIIRAWAWAGLETFAAA